MFEIGEEANVDPDERLNRYDSEPLVVARLKEELATFAAAEVTCEEADTCGEPDPRAVPAFEAAGYYVPWLYEETPAATTTAAATAT